MAKPKKEAYVPAIEPAVASPAVTKIASSITEISGIADAILKALETIPAIAGPAAVADEIVVLVAELASKAVTAWSQASGTPITVESLNALLPNPVPLSAPDPAAAGAHLEVKPGPGLHTVTPA